MAEENPNNCHDEETNAYWDDLAIRAADRMVVTNLVKSHKQLFSQVDTDKITVEDATTNFERERTRCALPHKPGNKHANLRVIETLIERWHDPISPDRYGMA